MIQFMPANHSITNVLSPKKKLMFDWKKNSFDLSRNREIFGFIIKPKNKGYLSLVLTDDKEKSQSGLSANDPY